MIKGGVYIRWDDKGEEFGSNGMIRGGIWIKWDDKGIEEFGSNAGL